MEQSGVTHKIKECVSNLVNNKTQIDMATLHPDKSGKWSVKLQMFYNKHFPTDQASYAVRLPVVSLALSLCAIQAFVNLLGGDPPRMREYLMWAIIVLISASTYGLYYGMKIGDRKQFTPWIIFKVIEMIVVAFGFICTVTKMYHIYGSTMRSLVLGCIVIAGNFYLLSTVCRKKREDPVDVNENVEDEFSPVISAA